MQGQYFTGILRIGDTAYVLYYTDDIADGAFPDFEQQTFLSMISHIENIKNVAIIIAAETVEGLIGYLMPEKSLKSHGALFRSRSLWKDGSMISIYCLWIRTE